MESNEASTSVSSVPPTPSAPTQFELQQNPPIRQDAAVEQQPLLYEPAVSPVTVQPLATQQSSAAPNTQIQEIVRQCIQNELLFSLLFIAR